MADARGGKKQSRQYKSSRYAVRKREKKGRQLYCKGMAGKKIPVELFLIEKKKKREGKSNFLYGSKVQKLGDPV